MYRIFLLICLLTAVSYSADAKLNLNKDVPGSTDSEKGGQDIFNSFTAENALVNIRRILSALDSFTKLTDMSRATMSKDKLDKIGNTSGEIQIIGFGNWISGVEGTILKQEYQIKKLKYDLAQERYKAGKISEGELQKAKKDFEDGEKKFQKFWDNFQVLD